MAEKPGDGKEHGVVNRGYSRREVLLTGMASTAAVVLGPRLLGDRAHAQQKVSKAMVQYQDSPKDGHQCSGCSNFVPPSACKVVEGRISLRGWCTIWTPK